MGILFTIQTAKPAFFTYHDTGGIDAGVSYYTISFSLNVLLTVMIVARLVLHRRNARNSAGSHARASGLYDAIIAMLIESSALYAVTFLSYIVPWSFKLGSEFIFFPILAGTQVCAIATYCRYAETLGHCLVIVVTGRLSARFSSPYEWPTKEHQRTRPSYLGISGRSISRAKGKRSVMRPCVTNIPRIQWIPIGRLLAGGVLGLRRRSTSTSISMRPRA
jgi:hypothetical protein